MTFVVQFLSYALIAIFVENLVLQRGLGISTTVTSLKTPKSIFMFGGILTGMTMLASMAAYGANMLLSLVSFRAFIRPLVFILIMTALYYIIYLIVAVAMKKGDCAFVKMLGYATFNCALLGSILLATVSKYSFMQSLGFGLGTGIGFIMASLFVFEGKKRLTALKMPAAFTGLPAMLIYIGIISLAIYGIVGHQLPF